MTVSYARYEGYDDGSEASMNECNRVCWNTLFMVANFDKHLEYAAETNNANFLIQRGGLTTDDNVQNMHTIMAARNLTLGGGNYTTRFLTPTGVMCEFMFHK